MRKTQIARGQALPAILSASKALFEMKGFVATSIDAIAREARVARPTIFTAAGSKAAILQKLLELEVAGPSQAPSPLDLPWLKTISELTSQRAIIESFTHNIRLTGERISRLYWVAECASESDSEVAEVFKIIREGRLQVGMVVAQQLHAKYKVPAPFEIPYIASTLNTVASPASWRALVEVNDWTPQQFEDWSTHVISKAILP